jgi:LCP family protein required for cell wall assembly
LDHFIQTDFNGFQAIIDTLGGIDIDTAVNLSDRCDLPYSHGSYCSVGPGHHLLDGALALWYVRSRYSISDFDRGRRAQEVTEGIFNKLISWNALTKAPELFSLF